MRAKICQTPGCGGVPAAPGGTGTVCEPCVIRELDKAGFDYRGPFRGANHPTPAVHRACGQPAAPRLSELRQGRPSGCKTCRYAKASASQRRPLTEVTTALERHDQHLGDAKIRDRQYEGARHRGDERRSVASNRYPAA
jgi:hypothetical protein